MPEEWARTHIGGVVGIRLIKELRGIPCIEMGNELVTKKMITTTRMFGKNVTKLSDIQEAVSTYTSRAAEKLRRQNSVASMIQVFMVAKEQSHSANFSHGATISAYVTLPVATSVTNELIMPALKMVTQLYEPGRVYKKAGVMLSGLVSENCIQSNLFQPPVHANKRSLMQALDNINFSMRDDVIRFASSGIKTEWKMRREFHSPKYTSRWKELRKVD
jgi:DNA polymerase V